MLENIKIITTICVVIVGIFGLQNVIFATSGEILNIDTMEPGTWAEVPNSQMASVVNTLSEKVRAIGGAAAIITAWGGGDYDTKRDRLIVWGGGHMDYGGNELYTFDIATMKWRNENDPNTTLAIDTNSPESAYYMDGTPVSRHTYNYIKYVPYLDLFCSFGGAAFYPTGGQGTKIADCYNFDTKTWKAESISPSVGLGAITAYDPVTGHIFEHGVANHHFLAEYIPQTNTWISHGGFWTETNPWIDYNYTADIDLIARKMVAIGPGGVISWDISLTGAIVGETIKTHFPMGVSMGMTVNPGVVYVPELKKMVVWNGGSKLLTLDTTTWEWAELPLSPNNTITPTNATPNGTFGRFRYIPSKNALIVVNSIYQNVFIYKIGTGSTVSVNGPVQPPSSLGVNTPSNNNTSNAELSNIAISTPIIVPTSVPVAGNMGGSFIPTPIILPQTVSYGGPFSSHPIINTYAFPDNTIIPQDVATELNWILIDMLRVVDEKAGTDNTKKILYYQALETYMLNLINTTTDNREKRIFEYFHTRLLTISTDIFPAKNLVTVSPQTSSNGAVSYNINNISESTTTITNSTPSPVSSGNSTILPTLATYDVMQSKHLPKSLRIELDRLAEIMIDKIGASQPMDIDTRTILFERLLVQIDEKIQSSVVVKEKIYFQYIRNYIYIKQQSWNIPIIEN